MGGNGTGRGAAHFAIPDAAALDRLIRGPLPMGLGDPPARRDAVRDVYYDTPDGHLFERGVQCRIRHEPDGREILTTRLEAGPGGVQERREDVEVTTGGAFLAAHAVPDTSLLRAIVDPGRLRPGIEVQTDRYDRTARWLGWRSPCLQLVIRRRKVLGGQREAELLDLTIVPRRGFGPAMARVTAVLARDFGLVPVLTTTLHRARKALEGGDAHALMSGLRAPAECAVLLVRDGEIGLCRHGDHLGVFWGPGSGESACREVLERAFGSSQAQIRRLGQAAARPWRNHLEVWMARRLPNPVGQDPSIAWLDMARAVALAGTPLLPDVRALSTLHIACQSDVMREHTHGAADPAAAADPHTLRSPSATDATRLLDSDLSQLDFNSRILELAADPATAAGDRLSYLGIAASNLDEFVMVRVAALKSAVLQQAAAPNEVSPAARLEAVRLRTRALHLQMSHALVRRVLPQLALQGIRLRRWMEVGAEQQDRLSQRFALEVRPRLVPLAATTTHPFPHIGNIELALAVLLRHADTGHTHYATVSVPSTLPRFLELDSPGEWMAVEELICAHTASLFSGVEVIDAHLFRVTRSAETDYGEAESTDLLHHVADIIERRPYQPVVRLELARSMPRKMRAMLLQEFRFELPDRISDLEEADIVEIDGLAALSTLRQIAAGTSCRLPLRARAPFASDASVFDRIRAGDVLVHFPYDSFDASVVRFLREASEDDAVEAITLTLYRTSDASPVLEALHRARGAGKTVTVLVELKARFDEVRNIAAAKELRAAGVHVVYGVAGMKLHSKIILVLRREANALRRYAFVGSGNLNPVTAGLYTDVGLFTARDAPGHELAALTESLTGLTTPPPFRELLVSPATMLPGLLALIRREGAHAAGDRPAGIRAKLNGLDDPDIIEALYAASQAGVTIDLSVRGLCRLRPGVPGLSEHIRVVSILGEFLEHARIVEFANGGFREYFIGSADWRERNLRQRVEVMSPVVAPENTRRLARLLDCEFADLGAWQLGPDGRWSRQAGASDPSNTQRAMMAALMSTEDPRHLEAPAAAAL